MPATILQLTWDIDPEGNFVVDLSETNQDATLATLTLSQDEIIEAMVEDLATPEAQEFMEALEDWQRVTETLDQLSGRIKQSLRRYQL